MESSETYQYEATPHKVHFAEETMILNKNSNKGTMTSESRKSILKRKSLFSSPTQDTVKVKRAEIIQKDDNEEKRRA